MSKEEKFLFHYTSLEGLLGIIENKSIWATNILYLNDASELHYSIGIFREQVRNFQKEEIFQNAYRPEYRFFSELREIIEGESFFTRGRLAFFVSSFSEERDLLSQWRGYCLNGIGFSLGFKLSKLRGCGLIKRCIYNEIKQKDLLRRIIENKLNKIKNIAKDDFEVWERMKNDTFIDIISEFIELAPTFKHPKFKEEKEWRIIEGLPQPNERIEFRNGQTMIIPFIKISL